MKTRILFVLLISALAFAGSVPSTLNEAIKKKNEGRVKELLDRENILANDSQGVSLLHWAVNSGRLEIVKMILNKIKEKHLKSLLRCLKYSIKNVIFIEMIDHSDYVNTLAWNPEATKICIGFKTMEVWDILERKKIFSMNNWSGDGKIAWSPDGTKFCKGQEVWGLKEKDVLFTISHAPTMRTRGTGDFHTSEHVENVDVVAWSPDGTLIATGSSDGTAHVWDLHKKKLATLVHKGPVEGVVWSPDGKMLCTRSDDGTAQIWILEEDACIIIRHTQSVTALAWRSDSRMVCTASNDKTAKIIDMEKRANTISIEHQGPVNAVAWSPDGSILSTASNDKTAQIYDMKKEEFIIAIQHKAPVNAVAWSPDGTMICTASDDRTAQIWNVAERKIVGTLRHKDRIWGIDWNPDGSKLCTGSEDKTVQVWDAKEKVLIGTITHKTKLKVVEWSPDGSKMCTGDYAEWQIWHTGGTVLDWVVNSVCAGADIAIFELLLNEYENLEGMCDEGLFLKLARFANKLKLIPERYAIVCKMVNMLADKPGAPL